MNTFAQLIASKAPSTDDIIWPPRKRVLSPSANRRDDISKNVYENQKLENHFIRQQSLTEKDDQKS